MPWSAAGHRPSWRSITGKALCLRYGAPTSCPGTRPGHRPSWRPIVGKALCLRYGAPTSCPGTLPDTDRVGAPLPAKPCASVAGRQHFTLRLGRSPTELAPHCRQSLVPPLRGANILPWSAVGRRPSWRSSAHKANEIGFRAQTPGRKNRKRRPGHRPSWRPITGKALCLRYRAPTFCPGAQPGTAQVGAPLPAKPYVSVTGRQHFALERSRPPAELAPHYRQSLMPPLRGANILPWSAAGHRPCWRLSAGKTLCLRYGAPTFCPGARPGHRPSWRPIAGKALCLRCEAPTFCPGAQPGTAQVGAPLPAKPYVSVTGRQHFTLRIGRQPAKFALGCPQSQ